MGRLLHEAAYSKSIALKGKGIDQPLAATRNYCHLYRSVVLEPVSANRLHENGNFRGLGWRLSANSRQGCRFLKTRDFGQPHRNPIKFGTFNQQGPSLSG
jgi:hypothetical protein